MNRTTIEADWQDELMDLSSAEEFLEFFDIEYVAEIVQVNRLHILQRFHDYLHQSAEAMPGDPAEAFAWHRELISQSYQDFVDSDALTEKVFDVFKKPGGCGTFVSIEMLKPGAT